MSIYQFILILSIHVRLDDMEITKYHIISLTKYVDQPFTLYLHIQNGAYYQEFGYN